MKRRNVLIGLGTAGAGSVIGSGAFSSITAERSARVDVAGDRSAYLAMRPHEGENGKYAGISDGTVYVDLSSDNSEVGGSGVNANAVTEIDNVFVLVNQGTKPVAVHVTDDSDAVSFRHGTERDQSIEGEGNAVTLGVGEQLAVGLTIDTTGEASTGDTLLETVEINAAKPSSDGTEPEPEEPVPAPTGLSGSLNDSGGVDLSWDSVQDAAHYAVYRKSGDGSYSSVATPSSASYTDSSVDAGVQYTYAVTATGSDGTESAKSGSVTVDVPDQSTEPSIVNENLMAWYKLDEPSGATEAADDTGTSAAGTINGATPGQSGAVGTAYGFDGTDDYVSLPTSLFGTSNWISMSMWVRPDSLDAATVLDTDPTEHAIKWDGSQWVGQTDRKDPDFVDTAKGGSATAGEWTHVAVTRKQGDHRIRLYVNGEEVGNSAAWQGLAPEPSAVRLGDGFESDDNFAGRIDDVRFHSVTLTASDVQAIYEQGSPAAGN